MSNFPANDRLRCGLNNFHFRIYYPVQAFREAHMSPEGWHQHIHLPSNMEHVALDRWDAFLWVVFAFIPHAQIRKHMWPANDDWLLDLK
jgi:hypothetical protein